MALRPLTAAGALIALCLGLGGAGAGAQAPQADAALIAFPVDWPLGLSGITDPKEATRVICAVDQEGRTYRLTPVVVGALDSEPAWSPDGRRLAFTHRGTFDAGVAVVTLGERGASAAVNHASTPTWSADGTSIAYMTPPDYTESGPQSIWVANADGTGARRLTSGAGSARNPAWSPDGALIAFESGGDLWVVGVDGRGLRRLTHGSEPEHAPDWSPDGRRLVFTSGSRLPLAIELIRADGTDRRRLRASGETPVWSPSGERIAFYRDGAVRTIRPDGSAERVVLARFGRGDLDWQPLPQPQLVERLPACFLYDRPGQRVLRGTAASDVIYVLGHATSVISGGGGDLVFASSRRDRVFGGDGADRIGAGGGNDEVYGGAGGDFVLGEAGADRLNGGAGRDRLDAGSGNDTVLVRDGERDGVRCGSGRDVVVADRRDGVRRDCDLVRRR